MKRPNAHHHQQFTHDLHRPQYHFLPPAGWMNDPNGLIQWQNEYHLFFQYNPEGAFHDQIHWGHAVSTDLVRWIDWPIALIPGSGGPDQDGCWSGCAVDHNGVPTLIYTGVDPQVVCIATSTDGLRTWQKHEGNPVIAEPPEGLDTGTPWNFRDPFVWHEGDYWYMLIASKIVGTGGTVLLYRSVDLVDWTYLHPLLVGNKTQMEPFWTGTEWECPNFFPLGDKHVLLISVKDDAPFSLLHAVQFTGTYHEHQFKVENQSIVDHGGFFYAPQIMHDYQGRCIMWGWIWEGRNQPDSQSAGWAGVMSLPRILDLRSDGSLAISPANELHTLRDKQWFFQDIDLASDSTTRLENIEGACLEILVVFRASDATEFGINVRCSPDHQEYTRIAYDMTQSQIVLDYAQSSLNPAVQRDVRAVPFKWADDESLTLHIFLDRSIIEVFVNNQLCLTSRVYPVRDDSLGIELYAQGGGAMVDSLAIWTMQSIW